MKKTANQNKKAFIKTQRKSLRMESAQNNGIQPTANNRFSVSAFALWRVG
jgi:hypothetical protein